MEYHISYWSDGEANTSIFGSSQSLEKFIEYQLIESDDFIIFGVKVIRLVEDLSTYYKEYIKEKRKD